MPFPVTCPACGKSFSISDEIYEQKIQGRVVSVKCKQCQSAIRVDGTKTAAGAGTGASAPPAASPEPALGSSKAPANAKPVPVAEAPPREPEPAAVAPQTALPVTGPSTPSTITGPSAPTVGALPAESEPLFAVDAPDGSDREMTAEQIGRELEAGTLTKETLVWRDGMAEWLEIHKVVELSGFLKKAEKTPEPQKSIASTKASGNVNTGVQAPMAGRFRPRQPTLPMGALDEPSLNLPRSESRGAVTAASEKKRDIRPAPLPASPLETRAALVGGPGGAFGNIPKAPSNTPVPSDEEPTVLRTPAAVAALLSASAEEELTPVPPRLAAQRANNRVSVPNPEAGALPPLPARSSGLGGGLGTPSGSPSFRRATGDGRPTPAQPRPFSGNTTQPLAALSLPGGSGSPPAGPPAAQKPPIDTFRESPEAKRAWFPEQVATPAQPPPMPEQAPPMPQQRPPMPQQLPPMPQQRPPMPQPAPPSAPFEASNPFLSAAPHVPQNPAGPLVPMQTGAGTSLPAIGSRRPPIGSTPGFSSPQHPFPVQQAFPTGGTRALLDDDLEFRPKRGKAIWVVLVVLVLAAAGAAFFVMNAPPSAPLPPPPAPVALSSPTPDPGARAGPAANAPDTPSPTTDSPSRSNDGSLPDREGAGPSKGGFADLFAAGAKQAGSEGDRFDPKVAQATLEPLLGEAARCRERGGPTGTTRIAVTFNPNGGVTSALVEDAPISGTSTAACITQVMKRATIQPFKGGPGSVTQKLSIQ